jgi:plastocyanin
MPSLKPLLIVVGTAVAAFVLSGTRAHAQGATLHGTVGPAFNISLVDASGAAVTHLDPGTYTIVVDDNSEEHNFHLKGIGVDQTTPIELVGTFTWTVTFTDGNYTFQCDAHPTLMKRTFGVGNAPPPTTTTTPKPAPVKLSGTVGPGASISLKKASGGSAKALKAGKYSVAVRDLSKAQNFHLVGPGVNKSTGVRFTGRTTWSITLKKGTYRFQSDPSKTRVRGSIRVT